MKKTARKKVKQRGWKPELVIPIIITLVVLAIILVAVINSNQKSNTRAKAAEPAKLVIYGDALAAGWKEWSNANVDIAERSPVFAGTRSTSYRAKSANSKLYFHSINPINTTSYETLHFALYGTALNQKYGVVLLGKNEVYLTQLTSLDAFGGQPLVKQWKEYKIPLTALNANGKEITGFILQGMSGGAQPRVYIDEIALQGIYFTNLPTSTPGVTIYPNNPSPAQPTPTIPAPTPTPTQVVPTNIPTAGGWWKPTPNQPLHMHWQLSQDFVYPRDVVPGANVYDIDGERTSAATVKALKDMGAAQGKDIKVICYIDVGAFETYRSDASKFPGKLPDGTRNFPYTGDPQFENVDIIGSKDIGWDGSYWMDIRRLDILRPIMEARIKDWCYAKGFDAVEPDESEVWNNKPGFPISIEQNVAYSKMIAEIAHSYGLSVGLKGNNAEAAMYESFSDWSLSEECYQYNECNSLYNAFITNNKAVFIVEYASYTDSTWNTKCNDANSKKMNAMRRDLNLVGPSGGGYLYKPCVQNTTDSW